MSSFLANALLLAPIRILFLIAETAECSENDFHYRKHSVQKRAFKAYFCTNQFRGIRLLLRHINFTPVAMQSVVEIDKISRFGVIYPKFGFEKRKNKRNSPRVSDTIVPAVARMFEVSGLPVVYCAYSLKPSAQAGVRVWLKPLDFWSWTLLLLTTGGVSVVLMRKETKLEMLILSIYLLLGETLEKKRSILLLTAGIAIFFVHSVYEEMITSNLIVPSRHEVIESLAAFFQLGYNLSYLPPCDKYHRMSHERMIKYELGFIGKNVTDKLVPLQTCNGLVAETAERYKAVGPQRKGKLGHLFPATLKASQFRRNAEKYHRHRCYTVREELSVKHYYQIAVFRLSEEYLKLWEWAATSGLTNKWKSDRDYAETLDMMRRTVFNQILPDYCDESHCIHEDENDDIVLVNLQPLFFLCLCSYFLAGVILSYEVWMEYSFCNYIKFYTFSLR